MNGSIFIVFGSFCPLSWLASTLHVSFVFNVQIQYPRLCKHALLREVSYLGPCCVQSLAKINAHSVIRSSCILLIYMCTKNRLEKSQRVLNSGDGSI